MPGLSEEVAGEEAVTKQAEEEAQAMQAYLMAAAAKRKEDANKKVEDRGQQAKTEASPEVSPRALHVHCMHGAWVLYLCYMRAAWAMHVALPVRLSFGLLMLEPAAEQCGPTVGHTALARVCCVRAAYVRAACVLHVCFVAEGSSCSGPEAATYAATL